MTYSAVQTIGTPTTDAPRAWSDPVCTQYAVDELTQNGNPGNADNDILS